MRWKAPLLGMAVAMVWACGRSGLQTVDPGGPAGGPTPAGTFGPTPTPIPADALMVTVSGGGAVSSSPPGIACPGQCSFDFPDGTTVYLYPMPSQGFDFDRWDGACAGMTGTCQYLLVTSTNTVASFIPAG